MARQVLVARHCIGERCRADNVGRAVARRLSKGLAGPSLRREVNNDVRTAVQVEKTIPVRRTGHVTREQRGSAVEIGRPSAFGVDLWMQ